ncbi:MAG: phosphotransferase [Pirellulaceae bacterium]
MSVARHVVSRYRQGETATPAAYLGAAGGFSGAVLWKIAASDGMWCLRGWPPGAIDPARLTWIHARLSHIARAGYPLVPVAAWTRDEASWVAWDGRLWDLSPWLPGDADFDSNPTDTRVTAALQSLARFHRAARCEAALSAAPTASPSLGTRLAFVRELDSGLWRELDQAVRLQACGDIAERAHRLLAAYTRAATQVRERMVAAQSLDVPLQVCHGDLWHDHVLYRGNQVSGLIDFGAMKAESRATDLARLLGSLGKNDGTLWQAGIAAYEQVDPLSPAEHTLIGVLDQSAVLLSGMNWLKWLLLERRQFECRERVLQRLDAIVWRLTVFGRTR